VAVAVLFILGGNVHGVNRVDGQQERKSENQKQVFAVNVFMKLLGLRQHENSIMGKNTQAGRGVDIYILKPSMFISDFTRMTSFIEWLYPTDMSQSIVL